VNKKSVLTALSVAQEVMPNEFRFSKRRKKKEATSSHTPPAEFHLRLKVK
jgi:hypothetical protein